MSICHVSYTLIKSNINTFICICYMYICICIYTGTKFVTNLHSWILYCLVCFLLDIGTRTILLYCYTLLVICICWGCHCHIHLCLQRFKGIVFLTQQNSDDKLHDIWLRLKPHIILMLLWLRLDCIIDRQC